MMKHDIPWEDRQLFDAAGRAAYVLEEWPDKVKAALEAVKLLQAAIDLERPKMDAKRAEIAKAEGRHEDQA